MGPYTADRIKYTIERMDFVTCSTPFLAQRIIEICGIAPERVAVVPNMIDFDLYDRSDWELDAPGKPGEKVLVSMQDVRRLRLSTQGPDKRPVTIGIQGGLSHIEDWKQVAPSLKRIADKYGERVRFVVAGGNFDYLKEALKEQPRPGWLSGRIGRLFWRTPKPS
jgi:glycosyltransferase involved in cell wall biosynthesis